MQIEQINDDRWIAYLCREVIFDILDGYKEKN